MSDSISDAIKAEVDDVIDEIEVVLDGLEARVGDIKSAPVRIAALAAVHILASAVAVARKALNIPDDQSGDQD